MTRPTPDSTAPYTRSAVAILTGASAPTVMKLSTKWLKKKARGTGNYLGYSLDEVLRIAVAKELLRVGVQISSLHSLFASIENDWPRLREARTRTVGACLVLFVGSLGPNATGRVRLTTTEEAVSWLKQTKQTVVVIDVNAMIEQLEQRTGETYGGR